MIYTLRVKASKGEKLDSSNPSSFVHSESSRDKSSRFLESISMQLNFVSSSQSLTLIFNFLRLERDLRDKNGFSSLYCVL